MADDDDNEDISDLDYQLIGKAICAWNILDSCIEQLIWHLLGLPTEKGRLLTSRTDVQPKVQVLIALAEMNPNQGTAETIKNTAKHFEKLSIYRNTIVHAVWVKNSETGQLIAMSLRHKSDPFHVGTRTTNQDFFRRFTRICQMIASGILRDLPN